MFKKRRLGLQFKITFLIVMILFVMLTVQNLTNTFFVRNISNDVYSQLMEKTLELSASSVQSAIHTPFNQLDASRIIMQKLINDGVVDRNAIEGITRFLVANTKDGVGVSAIAFSKDAFNGGVNQPLNGYSIFLIRDSDGNVLHRAFTEEEIKESWYTEPLKTGKSYITDIYYFDVNGEDVAMYTWSEPLFDNNGRPIAVITMDIPAADMLVTVQNATDLEDFSLTAINDRGTIISENESSSMNIGKNIYEAYPYYEAYDIIAKRDSDEYHAFTGINPATKEKTLYAMLPVDIGNGLYWAAILSISEKNMYNEINTLITIMITIATAIIVILGVLISLVIRKKFTFIMSLFVKDLKKVSDGDLTLEIPKPLLAMNDEWGDIANSFKSLTTKINEVIIQVKESSLEVEGAANEIADGNMDLSTRTELQAASVEETSSSMEEMASTIKNSSSNSVEANEIMSESKDAVKEAGAIISDTTSNIEDVLEASSKIENITKIIENIAFQTNILALNAAVEAARAGEQGRGFAVVASEVRNLAQTTQTSVKDITNLVADVNEKIKKSTESVYRSKTIFDEIEIKIENSSKLISDISTTAVEQQSGIEEINKAIAEIDMAIQQNAALVEESTASSEAMLSQAKKLVDIVGFFKTKN